MSPPLQHASVCLFDAKGYRALLGLAAQVVGFKALDGARRLRLGLLGVIHDTAVNARGVLKVCKNDSRRASHGL